MHARTLAACAAAALALLAPSGLSRDDNPHARIRNWQPAEMNETMMLAPAIVAATGAPPGLLQVDVERPTRILIETVLSQRDRPLVLPPRDRAEVLPEGVTTTMRADETIGSPGRRQAARLTVVSIFTLDGPDGARHVLDVRGPAGRGSTTESVTLERDRVEQPVQAATFDLSGRLGLREPAWVYRIGPQGGLPVPSPEASTDESIRLFAEGAEALLIVYVTLLPPVS